MTSETSTDQTSVWSEIVGQPDVVDQLTRAATAARQSGAESGAAMTHAWLITGPPGSGRSNAARAFAAALQCDRDGTGCGQCHSCTTAMAGSHPDLEILATSKVTISIDEVRHLVSLAQRAPASGRWRVILVEDADRMVERTSNLLLKAIEEPPPRTVWLLCAPSPLDVVTTIRSRCRHVRLRVPSVEAVTDLLISQGVEPELAKECAAASQSHIGMARRLARDDAARSHRREVITIPERLTNVGEAVFAAAELVEAAKEDATTATADKDAAERAELMRTLGAEESTRLPPALRSQVRQLEEEQERRATRAQRDVLDRAMIDLLSVYRDVLMVQVGAGLPPINTGAEDMIDHLVRTSTTELTVNRMDAIRTARIRLQHNVPPLLAVEAMLVALQR